MVQQSQKPKSFILKLFQNFILKTQKGSNQEITPFNQQKCEDLTFHEHLSQQISMCKSEMKKLCSQTDAIEESLARKVVNIFMFLTKDSTFLIEEGILNLYIDLVQLKKKCLIEAQTQDAVRFVQNCIQVVNPLLFEFFSWREYKKVNYDKKQPLKLQRAFSLTKKPSLEKNSNFEKLSQPEMLQKQRFRQDFSLDQQQLQQIRSQIKTRKINQLLDEYLKQEINQNFSQYQIQINELMETCKICSKQIKINHLEQHVEYCQKKYLLKQELKTLQNKILQFVNELKIKLRNEDRKTGPINSANSLGQEEEDEYSEILFEIQNIHKIGSLKNTAKKIQSQVKIKQNTDKYQELVEKLQSYIENNQQKKQYCEQMRIFINMEKQILGLSADLIKVQSDYENMKQIVSSSTIRPLSRTSTNRNSQKKSRFCHRKNQSKSSKNSQLVDFKDEEFVRFESFSSQKIVDQEDEQENQDENLCPLALKTKQSLGNCKNVHFDVEDFEEATKLEVKPQVVRRKTRRVKSMVMFDEESDSDENEDQHENHDNASESTSKVGENVTLKDFEILKFLGKGAFGKVYAVRKKNTEDLYALKMIDIEEHWGPQQFEQIRNEHEIFKKVAGEHLVQAPFCFTEGGIHIFMMQFMPGGDLSKVLQQQIYLQEERAKFVLAEIVLAIQHLHKVDIIHRDLKPQNLVIDDRGHLKLTDFGLSQIKIQNKMQKVLNIQKTESEVKARRKMRRTGIVANKQKAKIIGTPDYIAPEIINGISINNKSIDWWSLGVIAYEILIGVRPFCGNSIQEVLDNILKFKIQWPQIGSEEGMISEQAYDLIQRLLDRDFINRLGSQGFEEIKHHQFFSGVDWESLKHQPASIMPNYAKIRELLQMPENLQLRKQIEEKAGRTLKNIKLPKLDNFIRFDILGQKTVKQAKKAKSKKAGTLLRLQSIKDFITDKQNQSEPTQCLQNLYSLQLKKKTKSFANFNKNPQELTQIELN